MHLIDRLSGHAKRAPENIKVLLKKRKQKKQTGPKKTKNVNKSTKKLK